MYYIPLTIFDIAAVVTAIFKHELKHGIPTGLPQKVPRSENSLQHQSPIHFGRLNSRLPWPWS